LLLLAFLAVDVLALVADALALVGLGWARGADVRSDLADLLLLDAGHGDDFLLGAGHLHLDAGRDLVNHVVAEADLQLQAVLALHGGAETDTVDLQRLRVGLGGAIDQIDDLGARHAPHGPRLVGLLARSHGDAGGRLLDADGLRAGERQLTLRALHLARLAGHGGRHTGRDRNRLFANARHGQFLSGCTARGLVRICCTG